MIKLLIGGSPCTFWSIAQTNNRETKAEGLGWELFKNYLIAKEKFKPDYFLYENNKSASKAIKDQIEKELGVERMEINSALVSAQNRQRFYCFNWGVEQPEDRCVLLKDILENNMVNEPVAGRIVGRRINEEGHRDDYNENIERVQRLEINDNQQKTNCLSTIQKDNIIVEPFVEMMKVKEATVKGYTEIMPGDCVDLAMPGSKTRRGRNMKDKANCLTTSNGFYQYCGTVDKPIYDVKGGMITIKDKRYPIKLADGQYIIRKLTPVECERLQTMPDNYTATVSDAQRYKGLGNGWTAEVIIHILNGALKDVPKDEEIVVLSMYDGIGTGRYCLDKMGFTNVKYFAYEIDKYAKQVAMSNYPDIIQLGDAFDLRNPDWTIGY